MAELRFDGRVVIITGAGGGLGREYALEYGKRGAKVVVNDLGGTLGGGGKSTRAADLVVEEIRKRGGIAVANYDSVTENGSGIVDTAINNFGRIDILINNAGILRDVTVAKMSERDFAQVIDVHLNGAYYLSKAAWPHMRKQKFGRIVNTASPAGLYGNFGQANYSAAKLGMVGLSETLSKEGLKYNINANCIAPLARSRMTEKVLPKNILKELGADKIVPLVVYLTHESTNVTNSIFELAAGFYGQIRWERSAGELFYPDIETLTPEIILPRFKNIVEFKDKSFKKIEHPIQLTDYNDLINKGRQLPQNNSGPSFPINSLRGKVAVITGAGGGLGRSHAHWFAKYGCKVIINDIKDPESVVKEINSLYGLGTAIPDYHNVVSEAEEIIKTAISKFGRVDILINNAGILRDKSFIKMTDQEWDAVIKVHLFSTFALCKAVWPIFSSQKSGYIINTTSTSGIYGNFGQANYAAAKAAILGFSRTLAIEGLKRGITVNIIAPHAETAMTRTIFSNKELQNHFDPGLVSPFVVLLCSDELQSLTKNRIKGLLFEIGGGWCGLTRWQRSKGIVNLSATPEFLKENWKELTDFSKATVNPGSTQESSMLILQAVHKYNSKTKQKPGTYSYTSRDVILYNLGLGATTRELKYTYENHPQFQVLPTFATIPFMANENMDIDLEDYVDNFNYSMLLHGEQYFKINKFPLPTHGNLKTIAKPLQVLEKNGKAAVIVVGFDSIDVDTKESIIYNEGTFFVRNATVPTHKRINKINERASFALKKISTNDLGTPDFEKEITTFEDQATLYRLSGDYNPLHIDPQLAKAIKFPKPILHGLCTLGVSTKQLFEKYGAFDELKVRFTNIVFPGDKLKVKSWKKGDIVIFQTIDLNTGQIVLDNAAIKLIGKPRL